MDITDIHVVKVAIGFLVCLFIPKSLGYCDTHFNIFVSCYPVSIFPCSNASAIQLLSDDFPFLSGLIHSPGLQSYVHALHIKVCIIC